MCCSLECLDDLSTTNECGTRYHYREIDSFAHDRPWRFGHKECGGTQTASWCTDWRQRRTNQVTDENIASSQRAIVATGSTLLTVNRIRSTNATCSLSLSRSLGILRLVIVVYVICGGFLSTSYIAKSHNHTTVICYAYLSNIKEIKNGGRRPSSIFNLDYWIYALYFYS